jgi:HEAT repeat protein
MRRCFALLLSIPLAAGCGQKVNYPERPSVRAGETSPDGPLIGGKPISVWMKDLASPDEETRRSACKFMASPGEKQAVILLLGALKDDKSPIVRAQAAEGLRLVGKEHTREALPALIAALRDPDDRVKTKAAEAVTEFRYDARLAVPALEELWRSPNNDVKAAAGRALRHIDIDAATNFGVPAP